MIDKCIFCNLGNKAIYSLVDDDFTKANIDSLKEYYNDSDVVLYFHNNHFRGFDLCRIVGYNLYDIKLNMKGHGVIAELDGHSVKEIFLDKLTTLMETE